MKKVNFWELPLYEENNIRYYVIVFTKDSFKKNYTVKSRSYAFSTDNKWFHPYALGRSLYANCLDGTDKGVRLDWYFGDWKIEYCYEITKEQYEDLFR